MHWPLEGWLLHEEAGVAVTVPPNWYTVRATTGVVAGGEEGSPAYYTTLAIQVIRPAQKARFADILRSAYELPAINDSMPPHYEPCVAGDVLGLCYAVEMTVFAEPRRRLGVLLDLEPYVVDVSFTAPASDYADHVDVFERALDTLYVEPTG